MIFFCIFFLLFGPKIGYLDTSVAIPGVLLLISKKFTTKISHEFTMAMVPLYFLLSYVLLIQIITTTISIDDFARLARALICVLIIGALLSKKSAAQLMRVNNAILGSLLLHSFLVCAMALHHPSNEYLAHLLGNKAPPIYRSSGLMAGYDISGTLSVIGIVLIAFNVARPKTMLAEHAYVGTFVAAAYFSSRVSLILALVFASLHFYKVISNRSSSILKKVALSISMTLLLVYTGHQALVIFEATLNLGFIDVSEEIKTEILLRSASHDISQLPLYEMFYLPQDSLSLLLGTGKDTLGSDVGYIKEIYRAGIVGLVIAIAIHVIFLATCFKGGWSEKNEKTLGAITILILILLLSLKNNYLLVRSIFPLFLMVVYSTGKLTQKLNLRHSEVVSEKADQSPNPQYAQQ